jgi:hypothetical protein
VKHVLSRWGTVLAPVLLVAGAAAVAIALNVLLLGYASADASDPVGRFRPELDTAGQTVQVPDRTTVGPKTGRSKRQTRAERPRRPPAPTSSPADVVRPAYDSADPPALDSESEFQYEKDDD